VFPVRYEHHVLRRSKAIPVRVYGSLQGPKMLRIPHCLDSRLIGGSKVVSLMCRPSLYSPETLLFPADMS
jgi:hypothetical protein